jgi:hypothetical protein
MESKPRKIWSIGVGFT